MANTETLRALESRILAVYTEWRPVSDALYASLSENGIPATCRRGCGACCHFPLITVSSGEAYVLYRRLLERASSHEALHEALRSYAAAYFSLARQYGSLPFTDEQQRAFLQHGLPCPLFVASSAGPFAGGCGVYPERPVICDSFHSLDAPSLCAEKAPHRTAEVLISAGEEALRLIRECEYEILGRSALGHLPLFLAAMTHEEGRILLLRQAEDDGLSGEERQAALDFQLFTELLAVAGYIVGENDIASLLQAQGGGQ